MCQNQTDILIFSFLEPLYHQEILQKDSTGVMSKLSYLQQQHQNDHFLADQQTWCKRLKSFSDWIIQADMISNFMHQSELQLAWANAEGIGYKLIEGMPHTSTLDRVKKRLCQVFGPVMNKMHAATRIHFRPQSSNETSQEYIQDSQT